MNEPSPRSPVRRRINGKRLLWLALRGYVLVCVLVYVFQGYLLYHPNAEDSVRAAKKFARLGLEAWPSAGDYRALVKRDGSDVEAANTIVWLHGNSGSAAGQAAMIARFKALDARVHLYEFPGYGPRGGEVSEESLVSDLVDTLDLVAAERPGKPLLLMGESLGTAVICGALARTKAEVAALLLVTPFSTLADAAAKKFWFLPARLLLREDYDNVAALQGWKIPLAILIATEDRTTPPELGRDLFDSYEGPKRLWVLEGSEHGNWRDHVTAAQNEEIMTWLLEAAAAARPRAEE